MRLTSTAEMPGVNQSSSTGGHVEHFPLLGHETRTNIYIYIHTYTHIFLVLASFVTE